MSRTSPRSRARTVHGRRPLTANQLVDEMGASKDFQSPDIYALRRRQAQVDAARVGATRLRRSSTTMKLLSLPATVSKQDFGEAVPFMSRKRVDSLGMVHQQSESFDEGTHDNLFGGESSDDDDE